MRYIKIFGLPRSCTNVTEVLIHQNFKARVLTNFPCWKHGENTHEGRSIHIEDKNGRRVDTDDLVFIICSKHPYNWLRSLFNFEVGSKRQKKSEKEFLETETWHYKTIKPIDAFNQLMRHWIDMYKDPQILQLVKYEDMIAKQVEVAKLIGKSFNLEQKNKKLKSVEKIVHPCAKLTDKEFKIKKHKFSVELLTYINNHLDQNLVKELGYNCE